MAQLVHLPWKSVNDESDRNFFFPLDIQDNRYILLLQRVVRIPNSEA